jgi:hypothetical protein
LRLTNPLNLPAPGRSQTLYVGLSPSQSPVFLVNSRYRHFSATLIGFGCTPTPSEGPPSSEVTVEICLVPWRRVLSSALGFSPHPPVSVCGTDTLQTPRGTFLGSRASTTNPLRDAMGSRGWLPRLFIVRDTPTPLDWHNHRPARLAFSVLPRFNVYKMAQEY